MSPSIRRMLWAAFIGLAVLTVAGVAATISILQVEQRRALMRPALAQRTRAKFISKSSSNGAPSASPRSQRPVMVLPSSLIRPT